MKNKLHWFIHVVLMTCLYCVLLVSIRFLYPEEIVSFQGNKVILLNTIVCAVLIYFFRGGWPGLINGLDLLFSSAILSFALLSTFPVILDRSITLHMLHRLSKENSATVKDLREDFISVFVFKSGAIEKRIAEQADMGNVTTSDGRIFITEKGESYQAFFNFLNKLFNIRPTYYEEGK